MGRYLRLDILTVELSERTYMLTSAAQIDVANREISGTFASSDGTKIEW